MTVNPGSAEGNKQSEPELRVLDCPYCGYSLNTRPVETVCPECGGTVHRDWHLFGGASRWSRLGLVRRILTVVILGLLLTCWAYWANDPLDRDRWQTVLIVAPISFLLGRSIFSKPPHLVGVNAQGISVLNREKRTNECASWAAIRSVDRTKRGVSIQRENLPPFIPDAWRGNVDEMEQFLGLLEDEYRHRIGQ